MLIPRTAYRPCPLFTTSIGHRRVGGSVNYPDLFGKCQLTSDVPSQPWENLRKRTLSASQVLTAHEMADFLRGKRIFTV